MTPFDPAALIAESEVSAVAISLPGAGRKAATYLLLPCPR